MPVGFCMIDYKFLEFVAPSFWNLSNWKSIFFTFSLSVPAALILLKTISYCNKRIILAADSCIWDLATNRKMLGYCAETGENRGSYNKHLLVLSTVKC